jgi:hypothetical protein
VKHFLTPKTAAAKLALFAEHGLLHDARRREGAFRFAADR